MKGDADNSVIVQPLATSRNHVATLAISAADHSIAKARTLNGANTPDGGSAGPSVERAASIA